MNAKQNHWHFERRVNVSAVVQLITLAGLIVGTWANLQRQLDTVQRDVQQLLTAQEKFCTKLEALQERTISQEYRLQRIENK
ncbi:MAG: hypothetical protein GXY41_05425 [Phycisphaerae bacterium]|nr:hypothetical protein [Phycisphaerae bacterium]